MSSQLVFPFGVRPAFNRDQFIVAPCNEQAFHFIERWPDWPARAAAIHGPAGCGKTHLAKIWQKQADAAELSLTGRSNTSDDVDAVLPGVLDHMIAELPHDARVLIEDVDTAPPTQERDALLMALFERPQTTLLFTGRNAPSSWPVVFADLRSRFDALLAFPMWAPDETLLSGLVAKHFADRQLEVPDNVVRRILTHIERSPAAVEAFVTRADRKALSEKRAITERLVTDLIETEERGRDDILGRFAIPSWMMAMLSGWPEAAFAAMTGLGKSFSLKEQDAEGKIDHEQCIVARLERRGARAPGRRRHGTAGPRG